MSEGLQVPQYEDIGVRPLINCVGTVTILSGSLILPEVRQAMFDASRRYVQIEELMEAAGARLAELMQCEWGLVTCGCAAAISQVTAGCIAGVDADKVGRLPDTTGMKNEVLVQPSHRQGYDRAVEGVGGRKIEVTTRADLEAAIGDQTAMLLVFGDAAERGEISVKEMAEIGHANGVPTFVDAAAERPDAPNWYLEQGADAVGYSGGKCLRGPQASGLVLGRRDLLQAAFANGAPHGSVGRPMKAGKEEIMGLLAAVEQWVVRDHEAEWAEWERRLQVISEAVTQFDSVTTSVSQPGRSNVTPNLSVKWDEQTLGVSPAEAKRRLSEEDPRVEVSGGAEGISINPYMMEDGEEQVVTRRLTAILSSG